MVMRRFNGLTNAVEKKGEKHTTHSRSTSCAITSSASI